MKNHLFLAAILLTSCQTAKQLMDKAEKKDPAIVATYARDKYPCTDLLKSDTAVLYRDTTVYIDCPDSIPAVYETVRTDTVNQVVVKTVRVPVKLPIQVQTVTRWYEDSAKLRIFAIQVNALQRDTAALQSQVTKYKGQAGRRGKENWIWRAIAIALITWQGIRLWGRMTTIKMKAV
jgi:hypothetical protein